MSASRRLAFPTVMSFCRLAFVSVLTDSAGIMAGRAAYSPVVELIAKPNTEFADGEIE